MRYELNDFEWSAIKPMLPNITNGQAVVKMMAAGRRLNDRCPEQFVGGQASKT